VLCLLPVAASDLVHDLAELRTGRRVVERSVQGPTIVVVVLLTRLDAA
jgi:hypothetical protein